MIKRTIKNPHAYFDKNYSHFIWDSYLKSHQIIARSNAAEKLDYFKDGVFWRNPKKALKLEELPQWGFLRTELRAKEAKEKKIEMS